MIGDSQRISSCRAKKQVVGVQKLQGLARLDNDGFQIVLDDSQRGSYGSYASDKVSGVIVCFGISQSRFGSLIVM